MAVILISVALWCKLHSVFVLLCLGAIAWFAALGWIDDFLKDLGFAEVQHVGEFVAKEQSKFKRHLFICKK